MRRILAALATLGLLGGGVLTASAVSRPSDPGEHRPSQAAPLAPAADRRSAAPAVQARPGQTERDRRAPDRRPAWRVAVLVDEALDRLVHDSTLTAEQADVVRAALLDVFRDDSPRERQHRGRRPGDHSGVVRGVLREAARVIGITPAELRAELAAGRSLAEVAARHGVTAKAVIRALVAAGERRIAAALDQGRLTGGRADRLRERLPELAERLVHRQPHRGRGPATDVGRGRPHGRGG